MWEIRKFLLCGSMWSVFLRVALIGSLVCSKPCWKLASQHLESLACARILLVGYSEINRGMVHFLRRRKRERFTLITQHPEAVSLEGCVALGYDAIETWRDYDWIICASAHDRFFVKGEGNRTSCDFRSKRPTKCRSKCW